MFKSIEVAIIFPFVLGFILAIIVAFFPVYNSIVDLAKKDISSSRLALDNNHIYLVKSEDKYTKSLETHPDRYLDLLDFVKFLSGKND